MNKLFYWTNCFTAGTILLNELFYCTNDFIERTILLNERFYWTNILLNERFYWLIVQLKKERNRWKMNDNFENEQNQKKTNKVKKSWLCTSLLTSSYLRFIKPILRHKLMFILDRVNTVELQPHFRISNLQSLQHLLEDI